MAGVRPEAANLSVLAGGAAKPRPSGRGEPVTTSGAKKTIEALKNQIILSGPATAMEALSRIDPNLPVKLAMRWGRRFVSG